MAVSTWPKLFRIGYRPGIRFKRMLIDISIAGYYATVAA